MKLEYWSLNKILPYTQNARKIPQSAIDKVAASIHEYNWRQPIVVDKDGVIVVGHVRLLAAQKLGLEVRSVRTRDVEHARALGADAAGVGETVVSLSGDGLVGDLGSFMRNEIKFLSGPGGETNQIVAGPVPETAPNLPVRLELTLENGALATLQEAEERIAASRPEPGPRRSC